MKKTIEFKPPQMITPNGNLSIFLAGTIDMGESDDWQTNFTKQVKDLFSLNIFNPRRDKWDSNIKQTFETPDFYQQVNWELDAMEKADYVVMNILPDSKSPISLLELGLYAKSGKLIVCCPKEFYRFGNIQVVCNRYDIPLIYEYKDLVKYVRFKLEQILNNK